MNKELIKELVLNLKLKFGKSKSKNNKEIELLKSYISKSNLFNGEKKKIYSLINKYKL